MSKNKDIAQRQAAIKQLIAHYPIEDQVSLVKLLEQHYGIKSNQSIISRDLRKLKVVKVNVNNRMIYDLKQIDPTREILRRSIITIEHNETIITIKTLEGLAAFIADYIDQLQEAKVLATLAGENVVFVIPRSIKQIKQIYKDICMHMHFKVT